MKSNIIYKDFQKFGIQPHQVVLNLLASHHVHFVDDLDFNPVAYAEQFSDSDPAKAQTPEELLRKARMIFATELGKDPLLRSQFAVFSKTARALLLSPLSVVLARLTKITLILWVSLSLF